MNSAEHISQDDLALFALQLLSEEESAAVLAHVRQCDPCRRQVAEFQGDLAAYAISVELLPLPPHAEERFLRQIAREPRVAAKPAGTAFTQGVPLEDRASRVLRMPTPAERRPRSSFVSYLGWAIAAMFAVAAGLQFEQNQRLKTEAEGIQSQLAAVQKNASTSQTAVATLTDPQAVNVTLRQTAPQNQDASRIAAAHAAYLPDRGALVFVATNLKPLEPNKVYELWLLPVEANMPPIAAGSFRPDAAGKATVILPTGPRLLQVKGFGVTKEDDASAPKQPTLPILLVGTSKS